MHILNAKGSNQRVGYCENRRPDGTADVQIDPETQADPCDGLVCVTEEGEEVVLRGNFGSFIGVWYDDPKGA